MNYLTIKQSLNKTLLKAKVYYQELDRFLTNFDSLLSRINLDESEEFHKNLLADFLKNTYYQPDYYINTKGRNDLVIHLGKDAKTNVGVIIETKKPSHNFSVTSLQDKAFQELLLYFLRERISHKNLEIKHLIVTNVKQWFIFDANEFERLFVNNKALIQQFNDFETGKLSGKTTDFFYQEIAKPAIATVENQIVFTYFETSESLKTRLQISEVSSQEKDLIALSKIFSPQHLLKLPFANDSNSLDKNFYNELLYIIGLTEVKQGGKKVIERETEAKRNNGSLLENIITQLKSLDRLFRLEDLDQFGETEADQLFNIGLELVITWINRILFLKLLEAQLIRYHQGNRDYAFLNTDKIKNYDDLNSLFFQVLACKPQDREDDIREIFANIPYLNSSLFDQTDLEHNTLFISNLKDRKLPIFAATVLKDSNGKKLIGELDSLEYLFKFLDSYDFGESPLDHSLVRGENLIPPFQRGVRGDLIKQDQKRLITASVLGLIFEKINGYKDGSFFTPGFITMYMCRETIRKAVMQKFNDVKGWNCLTIEDLYNKIEDKREANDIINSLKICDPAVGSGHFLVSALNEIIAIKSELKILLDKEGKTLRDYQITVENDELIILDDDGDFFEYNPKNKESQRIQETLFHEKQTIIENCLFGVDINSNSVKICRLRLWIELLKNAYYKTSPPNPSPQGEGSKNKDQKFPSPIGRGIKGEGELETLPNIDINIKHGNSLISRFSLDADLKTALRKSKSSLEDYRQAVKTYLNAEDKQQKRAMLKLIRDIKANLTTVLHGQDTREKLV
jgi:adenine-specific DNA-methyltransferase